MPSHSDNRPPGQADGGSRVFRRLIIRQTLRLARDNADLSEKDLVDLVDKEVELLCDLCTESQHGLDPRIEAGKYFFGRNDNPRRDYVARLFLHVLGKNPRSGVLMEYLIPVFAASVGSLLGQDAYEKHQRRIEALKARFEAKGKTFSEMMGDADALRLGRNIVRQYREEMQKTPGFEERLKNCLDDALVRFQKEQHTGHFNIVEAVDKSYAEFIRLLDLASP